MDFPFNVRRWLFGRATKREFGVPCLKIEGGRNRSSDAPARCKMFGRIDESNSYQCTANTLLNVFLPDQFFFDLLFEFKGGEVVRCPDRIASGFKPQMISRVVSREGQRMVPQPSSFTVAKQDRKFTAGCVVSIHCWRFLNAGAQQGSGHRSSLQIISRSFLNWNL